MTGKSGRYSIKMKVITLYLVILVTSLIFISVVFFRRFRATYEAQVQSHMQDVTEIASQSLTNLTSQLEQLSIYLILDDVVQNTLRELNRYEADSASDLWKSRRIGNLTDRIAVEVRNSVYNNPGVISVRTISNQGDEVYVGAINEEFNTYTLSVDEIIKGNGRAVWGYTRGDTHCTMGRAVLDSITMLPLGVLIINCRTNYFGDLLNTIPSPGQGMLYLSDEKGVILASNQKKQDLSEENSPILLCAKEELNDGRIHAIRGEDGKSYYYYAGDQMQNGWRLVSTVSAEAFWEGVRAGLIQLAAILLTVIAVGACVLILSARRMMDPINQLLSAMSRFAGGEMGTRFHGRSRDEIEEIGGAFNQMADSVQNLYEKVYALELANKQAQIEYLKMQINPHFLYNSLDAISWMGYEAGHEEISEIAASLAGILRASIYSPDMITVSEEVSTLRSYLYIQKIRFEDKIEINVSVDPETEECRMPSFLLQPLVENCFQHGLEQMLHTGTLVVTIRRIRGEDLPAPSLLSGDRGSSRTGQTGGSGAGKDELEFLIADNGAGMSRERLQEVLERMETEKAGQSIGLMNVYRRLRLIYGKDLFFRLESEEGSGTTITFRIPAQEAAPV